MSKQGETFPAWAVTFARKTNRRIEFIGFFGAYEGGLVTEEVLGLK